MSKILTETTFPSVIHNEEVCDEIVKWGNANGYPLKKAKLYNKMGGYVGFSPDNYFIKATRLPPVPGGWKVVVEKYEAETRIIVLNVKPGTTEANHFILKMMDEYVKEGLKMELANDAYESYGLYLRDLSVTGHPVLINNFEDFVENMR
ncbi:MAG: hypothetical protein LUF25_06430 [Phascolarctobacterium sp.]|nr:hypothetical protein [Phascolarctobacterium sp.]